MFKNKKAGGWKAARRIKSGGLPGLMGLETWSFSAGIKTAPDPFD